MLPAKVEAQIKCFEGQERIRKWRMWQSLALHDKNIIIRQIVDPHGVLYVLSDNYLGILDEQPYWHFDREKAEALGPYQDLRKYLDLKPNTP